MEEEWLQDGCQDGPQDVKEVISMAGLSMLKLLSDILKEIKLLRKDLKK